jgi:hypothetical protein
MLQMACRAVGWYGFFGIIKGIVWKTQRKETTWMIGVGE